MLVSVYSFFRNGLFWPCRFCGACYLANKVTPVSHVHHVHAGKLRYDKELHYWSVHQRTVYLTLDHHPYLSSDRNACPFFPVILPGLHQPPKPFPGYALVKQRLTKHFGSVSLSQGISLWFPRPHYCTRVHTTNITHPFLTHNPPLASADQRCSPRTKYRSRRCSHLISGNNSSYGSGNRTSPRARMHQRKLRTCRFRFGSQALHLVMAGLQICLRRKKFCLPVYVYVCVRV